MKKITALICFLLLSFFAFADHRILNESEYPTWMSYVIYPETNPDWKGLRFGEHEVVEKVVRDEKENIMMYSKDDEHFYKAIFDKNGNAILNEGYYLKNNSLYFYYDYNENGNVVHGKTEDNEWWNTWQNGKIIYCKSTKKGESYYDYDENGNVSSKKCFKDSNYYIYNYKYDSKNRIIYLDAKHVDEDENVISSITEEDVYDEENDFVISAKITVSGAGNWEVYINGFKLENIKNNIEYKFEKLNNTQMKVIPQNGKHWFIVEKLGQNK